MIETMHARMTDPKAVLNYIFGGRAILTLRSVQSGLHYTYKIRQAKEKEGEKQAVPPFFVELLNGPDNTNDYVYIGTIFQQKRFVWTKKSGVSKTTKSFLAFEFLMRCVMAGQMVNSMEVWCSNHCARCGRVLNVPESIATGFGPECGEKVGVMRVELPTTGQPQKYETPKQNELVNTFKQRLAAVSKPRQTKRVSGDKLRDIATPVRNVSEHEIEEAISDYKSQAPELYYQDGELDEVEAHAVAYIKFKHELSKR